MRLSAMMYEYENQLAIVNNGLKIFEKHYSDIADSKWIIRYNKKISRIQKTRCFALPNISYEEADNPILDVQMEI